MTSRAAEPERPPGQDTPDWAAVGIGIMTIATIVAVATAAAAIALVREYAGGDPLLFFSSLPSSPPFHLLPSLFSSLPFSPPFPPPFPLLLPSSSLSKLPSYVS